MKIKQTVNELTLQETPGCMWIFGLFFALIGGIFVYGALGGFTNWSEVAYWELAMAFSMGAIALAVGVWVISKAPITKIVIDRIQDKVFLTRYGFSGKIVTVYRFDEIEQFCLIEEKDDEGSPVWSFGMKLNAGEPIIITAIASHCEEYERKYVFESNEFMRKQIPTYRTDLIE